MRRELTYVFLLLAVLAAAFLAVGISLAQTPPACTSVYCDSNIVTVTTSGGGGNLMLTVTVNPSGGGTVTGSGGINCGGGAQACSANFNTNEPVNLTATAAFGYSFSGWSGLPTGVSCPGVSCSFNITQNTPLTASFTPNAYSIQCGAVGSNAINISWYGQVPGAHHLTLYGADSFDDSINQTGSNKKIFDFSGTGPGPGYSQESNLQPNTQRWYMFMTDEFTSGVARSGPITCTTNSQSSDAPSMLSVFANSPSTLYVNWKDNSLRPHTFTLQRIKLTPKLGNFDPARGNVQTQTTNSIQLFWKNDTNTTAAQCSGGTGLCKGPFFHEFERVSLQDPPIPDPKSGNPAANPFVDRNGDGVFNASDDPTFTAVKKAFSEDINPGAASKDTYATVDTGLNEGTEYYYRVKACSFINADLTKDGVYYDNVYDPTEICSKPGDVPAFVATTTLPVAPSIVFTGGDKTSLTFDLTNHSSREDGLEVVADACPSGASCTQQNGKYVFDAGKMGPNATRTYVFSNLGSGQSISVTARAYRNNRFASGKVFSQPVSDARMTYPHLTMSAPNGGIDSTNCANPSSSPADYCSYNIRNNSGFQSVTVTAGGPDDSDYFEFSHLSGCDAGNVYSSSCTVTMSGNRSVTAVYNRIAWPYTVNVNDTCASPAVHTSDTTPCGIGDVGGKCPTPNSTATCIETVTGCTTPGADVICNRAITITTTRRPVASSTGALPQNGIASGIGSFVNRLAESISSQLASPWVGKNFEISLSSRRGPIANGTWWPRIVAAAREVGRSVAALFGGAKDASAALQTETVDGITPVGVIDAYFSQFAKTSATVATLDQSFFPDNGLTPDTAYIYRVKAVYTDGKTPGETNWSSEAAGKTLANNPNFSSNQIPAPVCTSNSFCDRTIMTTNVTDNNGKVIESSESQCDVNAKCANVGRSSKTFKEQ